MPTANVLPVAETVAGAPRLSASVNYSGSHSQSVMLQIVSSTWATDDPTITVSLWIDQSFDNGVTWQQYCAMTTNPGPLSSRTGLPPALNCYAGDNLGQRKVRAGVSVDKSQLTLGVDATV